MDGTEVAAVAGALVADMGTAVQEVAERADTGAAVVEMPDGAQVGDVALWSAGTEIVLVDGTCEGPVTVPVAVVHERMA